MFPGSHSQKATEIESARQSPQEMSMPLVAVAALLLIGMTTAIHYVAPCGVHRWLPVIRIPSRSRVLVMIFDAFIAHALEIAVYGLAFYVMISYLGAGGLAAVHSIFLAGCYIHDCRTSQTGPE
jgi:hypothetical protein